MAHELYRLNHATLQRHFLFHNQEIYYTPLGPFLLHMWLRRIFQIFRGHAAFRQQNCSIKLPFYFPETGAGRGSTLDFPQSVQSKYEKKKNALKRKIRETLETGTPWSLGEKMNGARSPICMKM